MPLCVPWHARVIYNATSSAPRGWYLAIPAADLKVGDFAVVRLPMNVAAFADERSYLPLGIPLVKRVGAVAGQHACMIANRLYIDGLLATIARTRDGSARALTPWTGCRVLDEGEVLLVSEHEASFDSRYFGPLSVSCVTARAIGVWIW